MVWGVKDAGPAGIMQYHLDQPNKYFTLTIDASRGDAATFVFTAGGNIWSSQPMWFGAGGAEAGGLILKSWKVMPTGMPDGSVILCDPSGFDPLGRGATTSPYLARYVAGIWKAVT